jgi:hypothetical protein
MSIVVKTESGSRYVFSDDGNRLVSREHQQGDTPDWTDEAVTIRYSDWPPRVGFGMHFGLACLRSGEVVSTSLVASVEAA